jgi:hypothetical protein
MGKTHGLRASSDRSHVVKKTEMNMFFFFPKLSFLTAGATLFGDLPLSEVQAIVSSGTGLQDDCEI